MNGDVGAVNTAVNGDVGAANGEAGARSEEVGPVTEKDGAETAPAQPVGPAHRAVMAAVVTTGMTMNMRGRTVIVGERPVVIAIGHTIAVKRAVSDTMGTVAMGRSHGHTAVWKVRSERMKIGTRDRRDTPMIEIPTWSWITVASSSLRRSRAVMTVATPLSIDGRELR